MKILRYQADRRTLGVIGAWYALMAYAWIASPTGFWPNAALVAVLCMGAFQGAVATHNAVHCPVFVARWMNNLWQVVLTLTYGHPVSSYVPGHNLSHHRHTETRRDVMRTDKARFRWHLLNLLFFTASISTSILGAEARYARYAIGRHPRWARQLALESVVMLAVVVALFALDWRNALLYVVIPWQYAAWGIVTINLLQHDGCDPASPWNHSRNFVGPVVNWLAFNNGFHGVHHLKSTLHWSLAPEAHRRLLAPHIDPRLDEPSLVAYALRTFVLPGGRRNFDGTPRPVRDPGPDEDWITDDGPIPATSVTSIRMALLRDAAA